MRCAPLLERRAAGVVAAGAGGGAGANVAAPPAPKKSSRSSSPSSSFFTSSGTSQPVRLQEGDGHCSPDYKPASLVCTHGPFKLKCRACASLPVPCGAVRRSTNGPLRERRWLMDAHLFFVAEPLSPPRGTWGDVNSRHHLTAGVESGCKKKRRGERVGAQYVSCRELWKIETRPDR